MKRPAFQFYPADWRKDVELQSCSMAAQGLWINAMCIAHECDPYGHLTINGNSMTTAQLSRQVGLSVKETDSLLNELVYAGVAKRTDDGTIFSSRMVKDEHLRNVRADAGRLGGNPNLLKQKVNQVDNHTDKQKPTPSSSSSSASSSSNKTPKGGPAGFDEFWAAYPKKEAKPTALKAFAKVTAPLELLLSAIAAQKKSEKWTKDGGQYIPMPATWLNGERWNDGVTVAAAELDGDTRAAVEREGIDKGIGPWDNLTETWPDYKARVRSSKSLPHLSLDRLGAMAQKHTGAPA